MKRLLLALTMGVLILLVAGVGTATASLPAGQSSGQLAGSDQAAGAAAGAAQQEPTNANDPIRVLSPGDDGTVSQSNEASSDATAANSNGTQQTAGQTQAGGSGQQVVGQSATNAQDAVSLALTLQKGASNENAPIRVLSPGEDGSVSQENTASSDAAAGNTNATEQDAGQTQAGSDCCGGAGSQIVGQSADNDQSAAALSATEQEKPSNSNVSIRVLSPGDDGDVSQSNEASSDATAANSNGTKQSAEQLGVNGLDGTQVIGQAADSDQDAGAAALTEQKGATNENISVRVLSPGNGGSVSQSNVASSNAAAGNANSTEQAAGQTQTGGSCKCGGAGTQVVGQSADSDQSAAALSATKQEKPSNKNVSIRVLSPGDDGDVSQSNVASSNAVAANSNGTKQTAEQAQAGDSCRCGSAGTQVIGQSATNSQDAFALGLTLQQGASNENAPIRVLSPGDGGSVSQSNSASSNAAAGNANSADQAAGQTQAGGSCKCGGSGLQVIGQSAENEQQAAALALTIQAKPSNSNAPIRVLSKGDDGSVWQSNEASSNAVAGNRNGTKQTADQTQAGGSGLQVIGQGAKNGQFAAAAALTVQLGASNENAPVRVLSPGDGGSVSQSNSASSNAVAGNTNWTSQDAGQVQGGKESRHKLGCCGTGIQVIGQSSQNWQGAKALAVTLQLGLKPPCRCADDSGIGNSNEPTRVLSPGDDGEVRQSNNASSNATAANWNWTNQEASQIQDRPHPCRCKQPGGGVQVIGQQDKSGQLAAALAASLQLDAVNMWAPDRKKSPGKSGDLTQMGMNAAHDASGSRTATDQSKNQIRR